VLGPSLEPPQPGVSTTAVRLLRPGRHRRELPGGGARRAAERHAPAPAGLSRRNSRPGCYKFAPSLAVNRIILRDLVIRRPSLAVGLLLVLPAAAHAGSIFLPVEGARVGGPVPIEISAGAERTKASLNGTALDLGPKVNGRYGLQAGPELGLRYGQNVLRVSFRTPLGERVQKRRFSVARDLPLAGAEGERVAAGETVTLRAESLAPAGGAEGLTHTWQLRQAPEGSALAARVARRAEDGTMVGGVSGGDALRFTADVPGTYKYALVAAAGPRRSAPAPVTVEAVPPKPLVPVELNRLEGTDTIASSIVVDGTPYPARIVPNPSCPVNSLPAVNVVVLDRETLAFRRHEVICLDRRDRAAATGRLSALIDSLTQRDLVLAKVLGFDLSPGTELPEVLRRVGGPSEPRTPYLGLIGVKGMAPGQAGLNDAAAVRTPGVFDLAAGSLHGYLTPTLDGNYTFLAASLRPPRDTPPFAGEPVMIDTNAGSDPISNEVRVGGLTVRSEQEGFGGFHLVVLDSDDLRVKINRTFRTNARPDLEAARTGTAALAAALQNDLRLGDIVSLTAIGDAGGLSRNDGRPPWDKLVDEIVRLGASRHLVVSLFDGVVPRSSVYYGLLTRVGSGQPPVEDSDLLRSGARGRVRALLAQEPTQRYGIELARQGAGSRLDLLHGLVLRPPVPWPLTDTPERRAALRWLSREADRVDDLRTSYWLQTYEDGVWSGPILTALVRATYPGAAAGFSLATFTEVREQLITEVGWLLRARSYIRNVTEPYITSGFTSWAYLTEIAEQVDSGTQTPVPDPNQTILISYARLAGETLALVDKLSFGKAGATLGILTAAYKFAFALTRTQLGALPPDQGATVRSTAGTLGVDLANSLTDARDNIRLLENIVVGDYGKLRDLARLGQCSPTKGPIACPPEWRWTRQDGVEASAAITLGARQQFTTALLAAKFRKVVPGRYSEVPNNLGVAIVVVTRPPASSWSCSRFFPARFNDTPFTLEPPFFVYYRPLRDLPASAEFTRHVAVARGGVTEWTGLLTRATQGGKYRVPSEALLRTVFGPIDPANPGRGGLGLTRAYVYGSNAVKWGDPWRDLCSLWT
jgi:hypothetical protein